MEQSDWVIFIGILTLSGLILGIWLIYVFISNIKDTVDIVIQNQVALDMKFDQLASSQATGEAIEQILEGQRVIKREIGKISKNVERKIEESSRLNLLPSEVTLLHQFYAYVIAEEASKPSLSPADT